MESTFPMYHALSSPDCCHQFLLENLFNQYSDNGDHVEKAPQSRGISYLGVHGVAQQVGVDKGLFSKPLGKIPNKSETICVSMKFIKNMKKFLSIFGGHCISMNIHLRKEEG
jgi:hypothetical protein